MKPVFGAQKLKNGIFGKSKMAAVPEQCIRENSLDNKKAWFQLVRPAVCHFFLSDKNLANWIQKTDFTLFVLQVPNKGKLKFYLILQAMVRNFEKKNPQRPIVAVYTFSLKVINPNNLINVASQGFCEEEGLIAQPPCYLDVSLQAGRDRVKQMFEQAFPIHMRPPIPIYSHQF